jgi:hypothetical protein
VWARCDAECSPGRGFYYHPARHSAGQPIVAGWCYSWLVALSGAADSWTAPLDARRLRVGENPNQVAAVQIRAVLARLQPLPEPALFACDGGYDPVQLTVELAGTQAQLVVRVRDDRIWFARPVGRTGGRGGRPRRHGPKVACADPNTWPAPDALLATDDAVYGRVHVSAWHRLHPKQRTYRDPDGRFTLVEGTLIRLHVSRLPGRRDREPKRCGCGGTATTSPTWTSTGSGAAICAGSTSSTHSASPSKCWAGPSRNCAPPSKPTGGPG